MTHTTLKPRRIPSALLIALTLLLIPVGVAVYGFLPQYYSFTALGEIVPVEEIGVKGSVHFCYIRGGVTQNRYELFSVKRAFPDAEFTLADVSAAAEISESKELGEEALHETIRNAVTSAESQVDEPVSEQEFERKLDMLMTETEGYYGDSLGLMLGIGLVEEDQHKDFSRDGTYIIAGTGTMEADHSVGSVGGIREKLRTAERFHTDYFFVPKDKDNFPYEGISNEEEAKTAARELNLNLQVIPVATLEEAVQFLSKLNNR